MENAAGRSSPDDSSNMTVALAASSMVNPADLLSTEAYQANLRRIEEMKDIVRRLEANNDQAHRNYLMDQLEKRAREGREAEEMLQKLRSSSQLPPTLNTSGHPGTDDRANVLLPSTATLVEVPDYPPTNPAPSSFVQPVTHHWVPQVYQNSQQSRPPPQQTPTSSSAQAQYSVPYPAPYPYYVSYPYVPSQRPAHHSPYYSMDHSEHHPRVNVFKQQDLGGHYGTQRPGHTRSAQRTGATGSAGGTHTHHPATAFPAQSVPQRHTTNTQPQPASYSQHPGPAHRIPAVAPTDSAQRQASVSQVQTQSRPTPVTAPASAAVPSLVQSQVAHPTQPPATELLHHQRQATVQSEAVAQPSSSVRSEAPPQQNIQQPVVHRHAPQQHIVPSTSSAHPAPQQQQQSQQSTGSQPSSGDAMFIRAFQHAVQSGPEQTAALVTNAIRAGFGMSRLHAAVRSVPEHQWKAIYPKFLQHLPANLLPRQTTSPSVSGPSSTSLTSPVAEPTAMDITGSAPPAQTSLTDVQIDGSAPQVYTVQSGTTSHITVPTKPASISPYVYTERATTTTPAPRVSTPLTAARTSTANLPVTPERPTEPRQPTVRTPQQADKRRLAFDILRSLGRPIPTFDAKNVAKSKQASQRPTPSARPVGDRATELPSTVTGSQENEKATEQASSYVVPPTDHTTEPPLVAAAPAAPPVITTPVAPMIQPALQPTTSPPSFAQQLPGQVEVTVPTVSADEPAPTEDQKPQAPPTATDLTSVETGPTSTVSLPPEIPSPRSPKSQLSIEHPVPTHQLQNLYLEERHLEPPTAEDVRMASPPPSRLEIERVTTPNDAETVDTAPVAESSTPERVRPPPPTEDESLALGGLPLFLPSPPASLAAERSSAPPPPDTDDDALALDDVGSPPPSRKRYSTEHEDGDAVDDDGSVIRVKKKPRKRPYVLVPLPPPYVMKSKDKSRQKGRVAQVDQDVLETTDEEDAYSGIQYSRPEEVQFNEHERLVVEDGTCRFIESPCKWRNCDAVLNCGVNLFAHLEKHGEDDQQQMPFRCRWEGCGKKFRTSNDRIQHFRFHAIFPIPCPHAGCDEFFSEPTKAFSHKDQEHRGQQLPTQPPTVPYAPSIPATVGRLPPRLPSHRIVPRRVYRARISPERHAVVGPWVLWNIFGPVQLNTKKQNVSIRGRVAADKDGDKADANRDEYDFLLPLSAGSSRVTPLDELLSPEVTRMVSHGLTLWGGTKTSHGTVAASGDYSVSSGPLEASGFPAAMSQREGVPMSVESGGKGDAADSRAPSATAAEEEIVEKTLTL
ncbi:hypothetical protein F5141DRAFT_325030 [Pisolithus sp. B1]|nr:hypothetical protein F5141DRAFT_325030 [Pisolithus sp. B1]